ncbi:hypothetical protein ACFQ1E_09675 [Sphingomonas canadensis]|uniref:Uncharacterized protein n=1 Tax=Sphingomonas canadensis TaxID=1219257 RepID=A0ABW3H556_9SPHN|nr:hypothetical protein [Sphingomonas canadensis]MCW3836613.1 hypothetical protein [Sphingomonas canadensis]
MAALLVSRGFAMIPGMASCGTSGGAEPVLSLEFARDAGEAARLTAAAACRGAQRSGLWLDMLAFIPAYGLFVLLTARAVRGAAPPLALAASAAIVAAAAADVVENLLLFETLEPGAISFALLGTMVRAKFALIALAEMMLGAALLWRGALPGRAAGAVAAAGGLLSAVLLAADPLNPNMIGGSALALMALLAAAVTGAFRPALVLRQGWR